MEMGIDHFVLFPCLEFVQEDRGGLVAPVLPAAQALPFRDELPEGHIGEKGHALLVPGLHGAGDHLRRAVNLKGRLPPVAGNFLPVDGGIHPKGDDAPGMPQVLGKYLPSLQTAYKPGPGQAGGHRRVEHGRRKL